MGPKQRLELTRIYNVRSFSFHDSIIPSSQQEKMLILETRCTINKSPSQSTNLHLSSFHVFIHPLIRLLLFVRLFRDQPVLCLPLEVESRQHLFPPKEPDTRVAWYWDSEVEPEDRKRSQNLVTELSSIQENTVLVLGRVSINFCDKVQRELLGP